jgi:glucose uptake protein
MIRNRRDLTIGVLGAIGAGILWGSYFIPIKQSDVSLWIATFPLTIGIFVGSTVLMLFGRQTPRLEKRGDYALASLSGVLWGVGNMGCYCSSTRSARGVASPSHSRPWWSMH